MRAHGGARLYAITEAPAFPDRGPGTLSEGRDVAPGDFAGRYRLYADGSLSGTLDLEVEDRAITGRFRSEESGTSYRVGGEVVAGEGRRARFSIEYPRTRQQYEGYLFAEGKGAITVEGRMIDAASLRMAEAIVARGE